MVDPLVTLRELHRKRGSVFTRRPGEIYVADPVLAKRVLANKADLFREHSDFFRIKSGMFGPRSAQLEIGRGTRVLLLRYAAEHADELPALVAGLTPGSLWPDAGNRLVYQHFRPALIGTAPSAILRETVDHVVERAVLAGARERYSWLARKRFRARVAHVLGAELATRRARPVAEAADLLDVLVQATTGATPDADLAEVFLSCLFAIAGSAGFLLGWSIYLLGTTDTAAKPAWVVREALRLWPVAWQFGRTPSREHPLGGVTVKPADEVVVCSYLVHRDPAHWSEPDEFRPDRWASGAGQEAYIPFGWGPHACTGAGISTQVTETLVGLISTGYRIDVAAPHSRPQVAAALAPPRFHLRLDPVSRCAERR